MSDATEALLRSVSNCIDLAQYKTDRAAGAQFARVFVHEACDELSRFVGRPDSKGRPDVKKALSPYIRALFEEELEEVIESRVAARLKELT